MDTESVRPIITGTIGGLLSLWLMSRWARFVPKAHKAKSADQLVAEYRTSILVANASFIGVILFGVWIFKAGFVPSTSWKHFALIVGIAILAPVAVMLIPVLGKGRDRLIEAISAFAVAERTPIPVLGAILLLGVVCLASALGGLA